MPNLHPNSTGYVHSYEPNTNDLTMAMAYNDAGEPVIRARMEGVTINGPVTVDAVRIWDGTHYVTLEEPTNDNESPSNIWAFSTENYNMVFNGTTWDRMRGNTTTGILVQLSNGSIVVSNFTSTVNVATMPAITGTVSISSLPPVSGTVVASNFTSTVHVDNIQTSVTVTNFTSTVNIASLPAITGTVSISSLPPVSGTVVASNFTSTVSIANTVTVAQGTTPWVITGNVVTTQSTSTASTLVKYINAPSNLQMDMTERLRVAQPAQSWWYAPSVDKDGDLRYIESSTGTNAGSIFVQNLSSINMSSGTASNGSFIRISRRRHKMLPGVSMLCAFSINWNGYVPDGNVTKRVGMFTTFNGVFFEMTGDLQIVIRRRLTDGTLVEKRIARHDFNLDNLEGTGATGYDLRPVVINSSTITNWVSTTPQAIPGDGTVYKVVFTVSDPSQFYLGQKGRITGVSPTLYSGTVMVTAINGSNITFVYNVNPGSFTSLSSAKFEHSNFHNQYVFGFDFNGSRATNIRFFIDGPLGRSAIHEETFGGALSTPFANAPAISTRYEIFNTGAPSRLPNFTASSELVNVEAEITINPGFGVAQSSVVTLFDKNTDVGKEFAILGVGLRYGEPYQRADLKFESLQLADLGNLNPQNAGIFQWRLVLNPTVSTTSTVATNIGKATQMWDYATGATITGGITLLGGYSQGTFIQDVKTSLNFINLGSNIAYDNADFIVLAVKYLVKGTDNSSVMGTINFIEAL